MTDRFDAKDLARAVQAGILQPGQDQSLLAFLRQQPAARGSFQLAHVAFYFAHADHGSHGLVAHRSLDEHW